MTPEEFTKKDNIIECKLNASLEHIRLENLKLLEKIKLMPAEQAKEMLIQFVSQTASKNYGY